MSDIHIGPCEDRDDPSSWDDDLICGAWEEPPEIRPAADVSHLAVSEHQPGGDDRVDE